MSYHKFNDRDRPAHIAAVQHRIDTEKHIMFFPGNGKVPGLTVCKAPKGEPVASIPQQANWFLAAAEGCIKSAYGDSSDGTILRGRVWEIIETIKYIEGCHDQPTDIGQG